METGHHCQTQSWLSVQDALIEAGISDVHKVDFENPKLQEIFDSLQHIPEIRTLLLRSQLQPILRNLVVLDWVLRAEVAKRISDTSRVYIGETEIIDCVWEHWIGNGEMRLARDSLLRVDDLKATPHGHIRVKDFSIRCRFAVRFGDVRDDDGQTLVRSGSVRQAFNSPFRPFVLATTSVGQEGLDFHPYCHVLYHWNLPSNPVDLEQREGRVHRFKGHAVRRNIAKAYGLSELQGGGWTVVWDQLFTRAAADRKPGMNDLI